MGTSTSHGGNEDRFVLFFSRIDLKGRDYSLYSKAAAWKARISSMPMILGYRLQMAFSCVRLSSLRRIWNLYFHIHLFHTQIETRTICYLERNDLVWIGSDTPLCRMRITLLRIDQPKELSMPRIFWDWATFLKINWWVFPKWIQKSTKIYARGTRQYLEAISPSKTLWFFAHFSE